jgi:hypothetical protein
MVGSFHALAGSLVMREVISVSAWIWAGVTFVRRQHGVVPDRHLAYDLVQRFEVRFVLIDSQQVDALYDAVLRPDYENHLETFAESTSAESQIGGGVNLSLGGLIPGLNFNKQKTTGSGHDVQVSASRVSNSYRHLLLLGIHYATEVSERFLTLKFEPGAAPISKQQDVWTEPHAESEPDASFSKLFDSEFVRELPRALVLLDFDERTKFIPTALESNGEIKLPYKQLESQLARPDGVAAPQYTGSGASVVDQERYWAWYARRFNDTEAMIAVEKAVSGHRIDWIDYRVPLPPREEKTLHLHVSGRAQFDTGVFAYNLVKRGYKHGLRIVGALKSEPDVNVLAIFDR